MTIEDLLSVQEPKRTLLIGFYGGGNYGDELLLEVLQNLMQRQGTQAATIAYQAPRDYAEYHHDLGYPRVEIRDKAAIGKAIVRHKQLVVGGGGLWGVDFPPTVLLMSMALLGARRLLGKKVYLVGVGYYKSTPRLGHVGAWLAAKAATHIIARDQETYNNFRRFTRRVSLDRDIAWRLPELDLAAYQPDATALMQALSVRSKTLFITLRRLDGNYIDLIEETLANNQTRPIIVALMEPRRVDPKGYQRIRSWQRRYKNVRVKDFSYNPLALYLFFKQHRRQLALIGPQFHVILTAHLNGLPFLPIAYDNKVRELFKQIGNVEAIDIHALQPAQIQHFVDAFFKEKTGS